jgi:phosphoribosyl-ATP pyrophosphohydrolase/phosphoribosyl-AMP cyclohydrolase
MDETVYEAADLIYHLMVLMVEMGISLEDIYSELQKRR